MKCYREQRVTLREANVSTSNHDRAEDPSETTPRVVAKDGGHAHADDGTCRVPGCDRPVTCRGLCAACYFAARKSSTSRGDTAREHMLPKAAKAGRKRPRKSTNVPDIPSPPPPPPPPPPRSTGPAAGSLAASLDRFCRLIGLDRSVKVLETPDGTAFVNSLNNQIVLVTPDDTIRAARIALTEPRPTERTRP